MTINKALLKPLGFIVGVLSIIFVFTQNFDTLAAAGEEDPYNETEFSEEIDDIALQSMTVFERKDDPDVYQRTCYRIPSLIVIPSRPEQNFRGAVMAVAARRAVVNPNDRKMKNIRKVPCHDGGNADQVFRYARSRDGQLLWSPEQVLISKKQLADRLLNPEDDLYDPAIHYAIRSNPEMPLDWINLNVTAPVAIRRPLADRPNWVALAYVTAKYAYLRNISSRDDINTTEFDIRRDNKDRIQSRFHSDRYLRSIILQIPILKENGQLVARPDRAVRVDHQVQSRLLNELFEPKAAQEISEFLFELPRSKKREYFLESHADFASWRLFILREFPEMSRILGDQKGIPARLRFHDVRYGFEKPANPDRFERDYREAQFDSCNSSLPRCQKMIESEVLREIIATRRERFERIFDRVKISNQKLSQALDLEEKKDFSAALMTLQIARARTELSEQANNPQAKLDFRIFNAFFPPADDRAHPALQLRRARVLIDLPKYKNVVGPNPAVATSMGQNEVRIFVPSQRFPFYTDDFGKSFYPANADRILMGSERTVTPVGGKRLYMSMRRIGASPGRNRNDVDLPAMYRVGAFSMDGGRTWYRDYIEADLPDAVTAAGSATVKRTRGKGSKNYVLLSSNFNNRLWNGKPLDESLSTDDGMVQSRSFLSLTLGEVVGSGAKSRVEWRVGPSCATVKHPKQSRFDVDLNIGRQQLTLSTGATSYSSVSRVAPGRFAVLFESSSDRTRRFNAWSEAIHLIVVDVDQMLKPGFQNPACGVVEPVCGEDRLGALEEETFCN